MPVKHLAVEPVTATRDTPVRRIVEIMNEEGVGDVIIVENERPVGIITDRDVALGIVEHGDVQSLPAEALMTEDPITIRGDAEAVELPATMAEGRVRRIPVVNDEGVLTGVCTLNDVVAVAGEELKDVATVIEEQSPEYSPG